jgi:hypothetical protein
MTSAVVPPVSEQSPDPAVVAPPKSPAYARITGKAFDPPQHFYPRVLNAQMHALVRFFFNMDNSRIVERYCHLHPRVAIEAVHRILNYQPKYFPWSGCDLFHVTTMYGVRQMVVIETNSCPSGQKSMPPYEEHDEQGGYRELMRSCFLPALKGKRLPPGELAVIYDKNLTENSGYAAALADLTGEDVHLVEFPDGAAEPRARFVDGVLQIRDDRDHWIPIRAAFRYVTQRPWNRIPIHTKTAILNPIFACVAGGRNKMVAAKAYDLYNAELADYGLHLRTPDTVWDVALNEVPLWIRKMGGIAVVKNPYTNAGQGVYTITNAQELEAFQNKEHRYGRFIVQSLIGHHAWSSTTRQGRLYHVGTVPNRQGHTFVADVRMMVCSTEAGFRPIAIYARKARKPLTADLSEHSSWDMLGTNLSVRKADGGWDSEAERLMLMDRKDFNNLGLGIDDLIEGFIQSVLATIAIDKMAVSLTNKKGQFRSKLFRSLNDDQALIDELLL